ncbi:hypothetical protein Taro_031839 [Colocasia esculenta]|uniref:Uncharacterized protein n=1 Tax=Colocasia esculenta TaxID=4460 RepID=A0A843VPW6_COLES|nr:hypothetical protein [Colocasia esculenta]
MVATWSRQAFGHGTPGHCNMVAMEVGVVFLSRRLKLRLPRQAWPSRQHRDGRQCRDMATDRLGVATVSRRPDVSQQQQRQFLVRSYTSRSPDARHLRACPVREVVTIAWDPCPRVPIEGVLRVAGVLELRTLERRGKRCCVVVTTCSSTKIYDYGETSQQRQGVCRAEEAGQ